MNLKDYDELLKAASEYAAPRFPNKSDWERPERYHTMMMYEIRGEVEQAFEDGARWAFARMKTQPTQA